MEAYATDVNRLVNDIKGFVAQLKTIYFENKDPIDDNEIILQKLCVKLETALRHGMKDKYSFLGLRKDYWNFFSECLSKDEGVRYVNSLSQGKIWKPEVDDQLNTAQGKGRALIRYCLVQKTLADTIQRTLMHKRRIEWFSSESLVLTKPLSDALISKLYDLNELEFHLSCTGCDLDMSWPAFGRTFTDGFERRTRRNSGGSIASTTDFVNERVDPLVALNAELSALKQMIAREFEMEKLTDDGIGVSSNSSNDEVQLNVVDVTLEVSRLHQYILKWKATIDSKIYKAENEIQRLSEERDRLSRDSSVQLAQLTENYGNLSNLASKESALQVTELQNKLKNADNAASQDKDGIDSLNCKLQEVSLNYEDCRKNLTDIEQQLTLAKTNQEDFEKEICSLKEKLETQGSDKRITLEENNDLKSKLNESQACELCLRNKLEESEAKLRIKTLEQEKLQEAFENVNGLVFSSFGDFESYYKTQLLDKEKGLEVKDSENKTLERRLNLLTDENSQLKNELEVLLTKLTSKQNELEGYAETYRGQDEECNAVKLKVQKLEDTFERTDKVLSKHRSYKLRGIDRRTEEVVASPSNESFIEEQCQMLVNDLNEAEEQLKVYEEALEKTAHEKNLIKTGSETLSLEVERLLRQAEDLKNENTQLCLDRQEAERYRTEMDDRVRLLEEDKSRLEEEITCTLKEKSSLESKLQVVDDKLQEESYLRLINENEVSEIAEQLNTVKDEKMVVLEELEKLQGELAKNRKEVDEKETYSEKCQAELSTMRTTCDAITNESETMKEEVKLLVQEKSECEEKLVVCQEQLTSLQCTMDQEVSSLRFQLSSQALKYDGEIKELSKEKQEAIVLKDKIQESEEIITGLENKLKERNETWQTEKKKLTNEIKLLKHEVKVLNDNIEADKQEIQSMESTLMLSKKQYEKAKERDKEYRKTIKEIKEQKSQKENLLEHEKMELEDDIGQLKAKLVSLLSDKSELWKRSYQLEFDMKTRLSETWVEDKDVAHCPRCNVEFSLFVRKHHCRFCGNVFCHACSENFVKTIHSRKPYRSCNACYEKEKELKSDTSLTNSTSQLDQTDSNLSFSSYGSDSEGDSSLGQTSTPLRKPTSPTSERNKDETRHPEVRSSLGSNQTQSDNSVDSDENYEIIESSGGSLNSLMVNDNLNVQSDVFTPNDNRDTGLWREATIPAGKRYLINAIVVAESQVVIEFTTSPQGVFFGVAMKEDENTDKLKTLIRLCEINSHEQCVIKQLKITCSGIVMFVFDNTNSKSTVKKLRFKVYTQKCVEVVEPLN